MKKNEIVEHLRLDARRSWGSDLKMCVVDPVRCQVDGEVSSCLVHCFLSRDNYYSKSRLEKVMELLNAFDYTVKVKSTSLLVTYYVTYIANLRKLIV